VTRGTFICDGCDRPTNSAHTIPVYIGTVCEQKVDKTFTFALCEKCDTMESVARLTDTAFKAAREWASKKA
jgi:hypothetical protein